MYDRNTAKLRVLDVTYYLRSAKFFLKQREVGRCISYLGSVKVCIRDAIKSFKKF